VNNKEGFMKKKKKSASAVVSICVALIGVAGAITVALINKYSPPPAPEPPVMYVYKDNQAIENYYHDIANIGSVLNGNDGSLYIDPGWTGAPKSGATCIKISYSPTDDSHWAGMMWLSGKDNFPPSPPVDGVETDNVSKLTFWAKGYGATKFFIENDTNAQITQYVELTNDWKEYSLSIPRDWKNVCVGFGWVSNDSDANGEPMVFYLDEIAFYK